MTTRNAAALLLSSLALAGCSFDGTGFGQPEDSLATSSTTDSTTTTGGTSTGAPTTTTGGDLCGNYQKDPGEECDLGPVGNGSVCTPECVFNICGDNYIGAGEACDGNVPGCENCKLASCGNGTVDIGEQCDDGNGDQTDGCLGTCQPASCGDGFVQTGVEDCDDGNMIDTDPCLASCHANTCGDGLVNTGIEFCDDGNQVDDDDCPNSCAAPGCGDGIKTAMEECDDNNTSNDDGCSATCKIETCGDGVKQANEECDNGVTQNADNAACTLACKNNVCGDGKPLMGGEECDDGNMTDTDACTNACKTAKCGDSIVGPGEECDDGNMNDGDACTNACNNAECGDMIKGPNEDCDDGNMNEFDDCRNTCQINMCGDGVLNQGKEACDHGPLNDNDPANAACKDDCTRSSYLVFVTSKGFIPKTEFGSIMAADMRCAEMASSDENALKIKGSRWKAWLSDGTTGPNMTFFKSTIPYVTIFNSNTTQIADDWMDLSDGSIDAAIDITDKLTQLAGNGNDCDGANVVWTGTKADNTAGTHCMVWQSNVVGQNGQAGTIRQSNAGWTDVCTVTCDKSARLYCFEQPAM